MKIMKKRLFLGSLIGLMLGGMHLSHAMIENVEKDNSYTISDLYNACTACENELHQSECIGHELAKKMYEDAVSQLLSAHLNGCCGLEKNDTRGVEFAKEYAKKGSESAISHLISVYLNGWYGIKPDKDKAISIAKKYKENGSKAAGRYLRNLGIE